MQQQGGRSQYGAPPPEMTPFAAASTSDPRTHMLGVGVGVATDQQLKLGDPSMGAAEEASPISSRPPAAAHFSTAANIEELLPGSAAGVGGLPDEDALGGDEADRGGVSGGNRWPRQETLALLKIRSDMDAVFRDASLKGPLWEDVSRKLAELGYKRSAKKCKEKFENVHKYYKRTKEGRAGRQDGKSYRFFTQLEALHNTVVSASTPPTSATSEQIISPAPVSIGIGVANPMPVSSVRISTPLLAAAPQAQVHPGMGVFPTDFSAAAAAVPTTSGPIGVSFSSDSSSSSSESDEMDEDEYEMELEGDLMEGEAANTQSRKRKRGSSSKQHGSSSSERMMEFFEGLMKQVMQKQEAMQQRFLEAIEKREQDRMIREEAWKRQEMARLAREHDLMAQERAISASRDSAIIAFLQKFTGQTIQLPQAVSIPAAPPPPPPPQAPVSVSVPSPQPPSTSPPPSQLYQKPHQQQQQQLVHHQQHPQTSAEVARKHQPPPPPPPPMSSAIVVAVPEQQVPPQEMGEGGKFEATSSRWPKAEVLALIKLRSGLEPRYQEAGPKGPLWEEISAGMLRMGYKRNPKRCKEKWENINKYFKKVKESNKKRPEDAKTCPYFHELDSLYRKKILGSPSSGGGGSSLVVSQNRLEEQQQQQVDPTIFQERSDVPAVMLSIQTTPTVTESENKDIVIQTSNGGLTASLFGEASDTGAAGGGPKKPEDIVKEQKHKQQQPLMRNDFDSENLDLEEDDYNDEDDEDGDEDDEEDQEEMKMAYKIQFQRQNTGSSNGGGNGAPSFLAMVQ